MTMRIFFDIVQFCWQYHTNFSKWYFFLFQVDQLCLLSFGEDRVLCLLIAVFSKFRKPLNHIFWIIYGICQVGLRFFAFHLHYNHYSGCSFGDYLLCHQVQFGHLQVYLQVMRFRHHNLMPEKVHFLLLKYYWCNCLQCNQKQDSHLTKFCQCSYIFAFLSASHHIRLARCLHLKVLLTDMKVYQFLLAYPNYFDHIVKVLSLFVAVFHRSQRRLENLLFLLFGQSCPKFLGAHQLKISSDCHFGNAHRQGC